MQESIKFSNEGISEVPKIKLPNYFCLPFPNGFTPSLILSESLNKLARNIENIPADEFEDFVNKYSV